MYSLKLMEGMGRPPELNDLVKVIDILYSNPSEENLKSAVAIAKRAKMWDKLNETETFRDKNKVQPSTNF